MLLIISTKYYIVNLVIYCVVNYLDQILYRQFSRQLCCRLSRRLVMSLKGSVHLGANSCCQIYSTCSYLYAMLKIVYKFQIQSGTVCTLDPHLSGSALSCRVASPTALLVTKFNVNKHYGFALIYRLACKGLAIISHSTAAGSFHVWPIS